MLQASVVLLRMSDYKSDTTELYILAVYYMIFNSLVSTVVQKKAIFIILITNVCIVNRSP